jgi:hypothetical protein
MKPAEIVEQVLKISTRFYLPIRCFDMLDAWARRTYL